MRLRLTAAAAAVALAGCGSGSSNLTTSVPARPLPKNAKVADRTYRVHMTGTQEVPVGAPGGAADAVISIHRSRNRLCWQFSSLKHVTAPLLAYIQRGPAGHPGPVALPLGGRYTAHGCTSASRAVLLTIEKFAPIFFVNIHNAKYPGGAVRAQLAAATAPKRPPASKGKPHKGKPHSHEPAKPHGHKDHSH